MPLNKDGKEKASQDYHRHEKDTGSPEVQVAILSRRITQLTDHFRIHKHDKVCFSPSILLGLMRRRALAACLYAEKRFKKDTLKYRSIKR